MDEFLQMATQVGVPASIGVICVFYLIKVIIPKQMETIEKQTEAFTLALKQQQDAFDQAIRLEQETHKAMMVEYTNHLRSEAQATREALGELNRAVMEMTKAVYKLYGRSGLNGTRQD